MTRVESVEVRGLRESPAAGLLARFLGQPAPPDPADHERSTALRLEVWRKRMDEPAPRSRGEQGAFARTAGERFLPGVLWGGEEEASARALRWLQGRGFPHATLALEHGAGGALVLHADEGTLRSFDVRGLAPALRAAVLRTLDLHPGDLLSNQALRRGVERVTARYPFLTLDTARARATEEAAQEPGEPLRRGRVDLGDLFLAWDYDDGSGAGSPPHEAQRGPGGAGGAVEFTGDGAALLWLKAGPATLDVRWEALLRHTPATGFAPGLEATLHLWDGQDRAHLALDGLFAVNTKRPARTPSAGAGLFERLSASEGSDFLAGARLALPAWSLAEVGAQVYALTDTGDAWRMGDLDSSLRSALVAQPDRDYFRRAGATALATLHLAEQLTLGVELRRDRFDPLPNPKVWSLLADGAAVLPPAPVTPGQVGALLLRAEWSSEPAPLAQVGALRRSPEVSLLARVPEAAPRFTGLLALERSAGALGSDSGADYFRALGDAHLLVTPADGLLLRTRLRAALVAGPQVPLQRLEALGGWSALRGYGFKEFRGDASLLCGAALRWRWLGAFLDAGAVHAAGGWTAPKAGAGAQLFLDKLGRVELSWRLDGHGTLAPSVRALFGPEL